MQALQPWLEPGRLNWVAAIDILIVAVIIYQFLLLIKGTRATQMLIGVAALILFYYGARWGRLETAQWLLTNVLPYFVFALIVIFQAEIRRALAEIGRNPFWRRFSPEEKTDSYDDIVLAVSYLAQHRIGALIVIEREIGLKPYVESGVALDARLSYDLLVSIFRPESPLHDGAVIVEKDRVAAAACFLPLSVNPLLSTQLGTRHRAAIGITEETDAVCVVVSEQTGAISLASAGAIEAVLDADRLRERLGELLEEYARPSAGPRSAAVSAPRK